MAVPGLEHVVWIGGGSRAGKTTVARRLARRHGLRLYCSDNWTWQHRDRALAADSEPALRWEALSPTDRTAAPLEQQVDMALVVERGAMVLDDLRSRPPTPLIVAEGTVLPAGSVDPSRAVWLVPTEDFQFRHRADALHARPWATNDPETMVRSFVCECGDPACDVDVDLPAGMAAAGPVLAPGHAG